MLGHRSSLWQRMGHTGTVAQLTRGMPRFSRGRPENALPGALVDSKGECPREAGKTTSPAHLSSEQVVRYPSCSERNAEPVMSIFTPAGLYLNWLASRINGCDRSIEAVAIVNGKLLQGGVTRNGDRNLALPFWSPRSVNGYVSPRRSELVRTKLPMRRARCKQNGCRPDVNRSDLRDI